MARSADIYTETLAVFDRDGDPREPLSTPEVADALDANRRTVYKRLAKLAERGELETKEVGSRARVWWRPPDRERVDGGSDPREVELERYRAIVEAMGDPVYVLNPEGRITFVNQALVERTGYDRSELFGEHVSIALDEETIDRTSSIIGDRLAENPEDSVTVEYEVTTRDGERYPVENNLSLLIDEDGEFRGSAGVLRDITARKERERDLERQRERLGALNHLNGVVRDITDAVIDQSNREEIERTVCERLAAADSYEFAWVAEVDVQTEEIVPRAEAGIEGFLESIELSADPDERVGRGPAGRTFRTGEMHVSRDVLEDPTFEPWRENAERYGFRSFAAIPIVYEETLYGAIGVYSARVGAFTDEEREVVGQLGEIVGHAIAASEQKRALMSDEVTEIGFRLRDYLEPFATPVSIDGRITFHHPVATGDGSFLAYGTATDDAMDTVHALADDESASIWETVSVLGSDGDTTRFSIRLADPPIVSTIKSHGGSLRQATIEDGDLYLRIHFGATTDVSQVVDDFIDSYPSAEMVTRRQRTRPGRAPQRIGQVLSDRLTERQQAALEAGYFAGFFEWPRDSSGEDVAASLDISPSTFHQHVRKAEKELLDVVYDEFGR